MNKRNHTGSGSMLEKVLSIAMTAMLAVDSGKVTLDEVIDHLPEDCRRILEHLLLQFYRYRKSLRASWTKFCRKPAPPEVAALLDSAVTQCRFQRAVTPQSVVNVAVILAKPFHADKFVNAVLHKVLDEEYVLPVSAAEILPPAVLKRWGKSFSASEIDRFARLFLEKPAFTFRLCRGAEVPAGAEKVPAFGPFVFAIGNGTEILASPEFAAGKYYIQDPAASLAVSLAEEVLPKCRNLLDLCAAPGGKTLMAAELLGPGSAITASDVSASRQEQTRENFIRHQVTAEIITADPAELTGSYDLVIADVPCSNTGVFRRRPDALWRFDGKSLAQVMQLQKKILSSAAKLTSADGYLLVSSCSIEPDENAALTRIPGFEVIKMTTLLPDKDHDGAFAALMKKVAR